MPGSNQQFGFSVSAVGNERVLISALSANTAYLFSTNGTLLSTITNPFPEPFASFGVAVKALGNNHVLIGSYLDNTGEEFSGAAYFYSLDIPYPALNIARSDTNYTLGWTTDETGLILQQADLLGTPTIWSDVSESIMTDGMTNVVLQAVPDGILNRFYRLRRP